MHMYTETKLMAIILLAINVSFFSPERNMCLPYKSKKILYVFVARTFNLSLWIRFFKSKCFILSFDCFLRRLVILYPIVSHFHSFSFLQHFQPLCVHNIEKNVGNIPTMCLIPLCLLFVFSMFCFWYLINVAFFKHSLSVATASSSHCQWLNTTYATRLLHPTIFSKSNDFFQI